MLHSLQDAAAASNPRTLNPIRQNVQIHELKAIHPTGDLAREERGSKAQAVPSFEHASKAFGMSNLEDHG